MSNPSVCVINVVGLTEACLGPHTPALCRLRSEGGGNRFDGVLPAVTSTAQATLLTGARPQDHGIVANGWLFRDTREVRFWQQSRHLIQGEPVYETARRRARDKGRKFTTAKLFWWFNQGCGVDISVTPKPHYGADGSKAFDIMGYPSGIAPTLTSKLGPFPFHTFWGPMAGLPATSWIARCAEHVLHEHRPDLSFVYLPHLDYDFQRFGPEFPEAKQRLSEVDECAGRVIAAAREVGATVVCLSEYGLVPVQRAVLINQALRRKGWLQVREGPFGEMLDPYGSGAFAVADHQVAHVYVFEAGLINAVAREISSLEGVNQVLVGSDIMKAGLAHERSGEVIALADADAWFAYPYWLDDRKAPDFARTVDIHRKPGYDPCELFFDPDLSAPRLRAMFKLLKKKLGFRMLMDLIPLDPSPVRGSHGLLAGSSSEKPILLSDRIDAFQTDPFPMTGFKDALLGLLDLN